MSETTTYRLVKPEPTDNYDIDVQNKNMDKIDKGLVNRSRVSDGKPQGAGVEGDRHINAADGNEYVLHNGTWTRVSCIKVVEQLPATAEEGDIFFVYGDNKR